MFEAIPVECDCCKKTVSGFYNNSEWWGKYLKNDENKICLDCIKVRDGFKEDFKSIIGVDVSELEKINGKSHNNKKQ